MTDTASKIKGLAWVVVTVALAVAFAYGISPLARAIPWSWEKNTADLLGSITPGDVCHGDPKKQVLFRKLVDRLYPIDREDTHFSIDVQIVNNPNINAFAELGGKILLYRGLLEKAESPEEIAGVLAHEITHVRRRHILEGFIVRLMTIQGVQLLLGGAASNSQWTSFFLNMNFTRSQEAEADQGALVRLQKAHISNHGFAQFFKRLQEMDEAPSFLSDHPSSDDRLGMVNTFQDQNTRPIMSKEDWKMLKTYCQ